MMRIPLYMLSAAWLLLAAIPALAQDSAIQDGATPHATGKAAAPQVNVAASAPAGVLPSNHTPGVEETAASCRARWKEYRDSLACFAPYRHSEHVLDVEAYKHCKVVKEPTDCPPEFK